MEKLLTVLALFAASNVAPAQAQQPTMQQAKEFMIANFTSREFFPICRPSWLTQDMAVTRFRWTLGSFRRVR